MLPAHSALTSGTFALPNGQFKHISSLTILVHEVTAKAEHNFTPAKKKILQEIYSPILLDLTLALQTFSHDPTRGLSLLASLKTQLESEIK